MGDHSVGLDLVPEVVGKVCDRLAANARPQMFVVSTRDVAPDRMTVDVLALIEELRGFTSPFDSGKARREMDDAILWCEREISRIESTPGARP